MITPIFRKINLENYRPGRSVSKNNKKVIKLSANESALGVGKKVQKVLKTFDKKISKYPDSKFKVLTHVISKKYKCNRNQIICGSGSDEIIQMLCQLFLKKKDEVIVPVQSFISDGMCVTSQGGKVVFAEIDQKNFCLDLEEIKRLYRVFLHSRHDLGYYAGAYSEKPILRPFSDTD